MYSNEPTIELTEQDYRHDIHRIAQKINPTTEESNTGTGVMTFIETHLLETNKHLNRIATALEKIANKNYVQLGAIGATTNETVEEIQKKLVEYNFYQGGK